MNSRVVFITGGTRGIGYEFVSQYLALGEHVSVFARDQVTLEEMKKKFSKQYPGKILTLAGDVTHYDSVKKAVAQTVQTWGSIDIAIANAGQALIGPIDELQVSHIHNQVNVNFSGAVNTAYAVKPYLVASRGTLVIIGSVCAYIATPMTPAYSASKAAVKYFFDAQRESYAQVGITVVQLLPGTIESDILHVRPDNTFDPHYINPSVSDAAKLIKPASTKSAVTSMVSAIQSKTSEQIITWQGKMSIFGAKHTPSIINSFGKKDYEAYIAKRDKAKSQASGSQTPVLTTPIPLQNKVVFMVGFNTVHAEMARQLLVQGVKISFLVRDASHVKEFHNRDDTLINVGDLASPEGVNKAVIQTLHKWLRIDVGIVIPEELIPELTFDAEIAHQQMRLNFGGAINTIYSIVNELRKTQGALVLIANQKSFFVPPETPEYSASIMAIRAFFNSARTSYEKIGISVVQLVPAEKNPSKKVVAQMIEAIRNRAREVFFGLDSKSASLLSCHASLFAVEAGKKLHEDALLPRSIVRPV